MHIINSLIYYNSPKIKICLFVCRCSHSQSTFCSSCLIVSTDIGLKLFISTVIPFYHTSQFGLAVFYRRKKPKTIAKTDCSVECKAAPYDRLTTGTPVAGAPAAIALIDCEKNGDRLEHLPGRDLRPFLPVLSVRCNSDILKKT